MTGIQRTKASHIVFQTDLLTKNYKLHLTSTCALWSIHGIYPILIYWFVAMFRAGNMIFQKKKSHNLQIHCLTSPLWNNIRETKKMQPVLANMFTTISVHSTEYVYW